MNGHKRNKARLLSRVSTLAIVSAAGTFGAAHQAQAECYSTFNPPATVGNVTVSSPFTCVVINDPVTGNVTSDAPVGNPGPGYVPFLVTADIGGQLFIGDNITGGYFYSGYDYEYEYYYEEERGALTIAGEAQIGLGIFNDASITSETGNGIQIGIGGEDGGHILNGITNADAISSGARYGIAALYGSLSGGLTNEINGTINGGLAGVYIADTFGAWNDGISNFGQIKGSYAAIRLGDGDEYGEGSLVFSGGITNQSSGIIDSNNGPAIIITNDVATFNGGIHNFNDIQGGDSAIVIQAVNFNGGIENGDFAQIIANGPYGDAIYADTNWTGNFDNQGLIQSLNGNGFAFYGSSYTGNFTNADTIFGGKNGVVFDNYDLVIGGDEGPAVFSNSGAITGGQAGFRISAATFNGSITNETGATIEGADYGVLVDVSNEYNGDFDNNGTITGDIAVFFGPTSDAVFGGKIDGTITNTGLIEGGTTGLYVNAETFTGDILNAQGATISGITGALIYTNGFTGLIQNNGTITGFAELTGLHIVTAGTHLGNIVNNGVLSAPGNALHIEIATLSGDVINTGTIESTANGTAVLLDIGNDADFFNEGDILGDLDLGGYLYGGDASLTFHAQNGGGIAGDINGLGGEGSNDYVAVEGTHFFIEGADGYGTARDLAAFTVDNGGTAVMGALAVGDTSGTGYAFANVDELNVNTGGTLYIDTSTALTVDDSYTQQSGGTLMFFLDAPAPSATGVVTGTAGQIDVNGTATLSGTIAGYLDPDFASANAGLTEVVYNDVIVADEIVGDFTDVELFANSAIWQMSHIIEDNNTVDLRVTRTPLDHLGGLGSIVVETAGPWKSMVNDRSNGIGSGSCGLAGDGWCLNRFAANEPGATQVMTDATPGDDPFAWLRTGVRKVGETAAWGRAVGVWGETDGDHDTRGTDFRTAGFIVGVDHVFTPVLLAGVAAQWTTSDIDFDGRPDNAEVDSFEAGAYVSYGDARLYVNANASFIWHDFEVNRFVSGAAAIGDYDGTTASAYVEAGKIFETEEGLRIQPLVAVSFAHLETSAYSEFGTALTKLDVLESEFDSLKSNLGVRVAYPVKMASGRKWVPEARVVWAHEFWDDQSSFLADAQGGPFAPQLIQGEEYSRDTIVVGAGVTVPVSADSTLFVDYDAGLNHDVTSHTLSLGVRVRW